MKNSDNYTVIYAALIALIGSIIISIIEIQCTNDKKIYLVPPDKGQERILATGKDTKGKKIDLDIRILSNEFRWVIGSTDSLESGQVEEVLNVYLPKLNLFELSRGIICVGMASEEGELSEECDRASRRADQLIRIVRPLIKEKRIFKLSLGRYDQSKYDFIKPDDTSYQRKILLIGIMNKDEGVIMKEAVIDVFNNKLNGKLEFETKDFSSFEFYEK